jgi:hypothetical protein
VESPPNESLITAQVGRIAGPIRNHVHSLIGIRPSQGCVVSPAEALGKRNFNVFEISTFKTFRKEEAN